ncbi:MAG: 50S ribosomal protein L13 [Clostridiales bacterium]|nr:50S ribosomal protein L13 [Clostridiales bacterium]
MKTYMAKAEGLERKWYVIDCEGKTFGRVASQVASILKGKHKPTYTPHVDCGDFVIVTNVEKLVFTGNKLDKKKYYRHTGHPGGLKEVSYRDLMANKPEFAFQKAVKGMLPKNSMGRAMLKKLKVYAGPEHKHEAQQPEKLEII